MTLHQRLLEAEPPRDKAVVAPYIKQSLRWVKKTLLIFAALIGVCTIIGSAADISRGVSPIYVSVLKGVGYTSFAGLFFFVPVVAFWLINRAKLTQQLTHGTLTRGTVVQRGEYPVRGGTMWVVEITYADPAGTQRTAKFQTMDALTLSERDLVDVIADMSSSVAVLWAPDGLAVARRK